MPPDKKKILIIAGAVLFVVILLGVVFLRISNSNRNAGQNETGNQGSQAITKKPLQKTQKKPEQAAKDFYDWYVNHPSPVKSGAYLTREDLTSDFKEIMGIFVSRGIDPGYDHVFCDALPSLPKNVTLGEPIYSEGGKVALIIFRDASDGKNLFQMWLENIEGNWYVSDASCIE
ncbi:MAG: hypothetical protein HY427_02090 [Candidatus Levybacteria bacterium]|nr:hypothetical protein [Candidatus Levybacteria bacterium]